MTVVTAGSGTLQQIAQVLKSAGIEAKDLDTLTSTDRGDVLFFSTPGGDAAVRRWRELRALVEQTRHWPVILGPPDEIEHHRESAEMNSAPVAETLKYAATIDFPSWCAARETERLQEFREDNPGADESGFLAPLGEWTNDAEPSTRFTTPFEILTDKAYERVAMALVPTEMPWEVPAYLKLGGWNECPEAAVHCAAHGYWHERYGAEIVAATHDVIEMHVARLPKAKDAAMELARQQYIYCADIVEQGTETLSNLGAILLGGTAWFFWWD